MNRDGRVDLEDVDPFVLALANAPAYQRKFGVPTTVGGDTDRDGDLDFDDIDDFLALLPGRTWLQLVDRVVATLPATARPTARPSNRMGSDLLFPFPSTESPHVGHRRSRPGRGLARLSANDAVV